MIYSFTSFILTTSSSDKLEYIPEHHANQDNDNVSHAVPGTMTFLSSGSDTGLSCLSYQIVPFLESVSTAATHGFTSALNFSVPKFFVLFS